MAASSPALHCEEIDRGRRAIEAKAMRSMWGAVILQAIQDLMRTSSGSDPIDRRRARAWIGSRDFHLVCDCAGIDGHYRAAGLLKLISGQIVGHCEGAVSAPKKYIGDRRAG